MMLQSLSFTQVNHVLDSWVLLQTRPKYIEETDILMFQKYVKEKITRIMFAHNILYINLNPVVVVAAILFL